jgi:hypothetical protein
VLTKSYLGSITIGGVGALVLAGLLMQAATPKSLGPLGVTAWFGLILVGLVALVAALAYAAAAQLQHSRSKPKPRRRVVDSLRRGLLVGGGLTILLALSSLRQLNLRDLILLLLLGALVEFYTVART